MALTKSRAAFSIDGNTLTAGAGNQTSTAVDISGSYDTTVTIILTNGSSGPTVPAQVQIQVANDVAGTYWANYGGPLVASATGSAVTSWSIDLPMGLEAMRIVAGSNTVNNVTLNADYSKVTGI